jgi:hypothetical protein
MPALSSRSKAIARIVWITWALGLCFVGYAASQSYSFTTWFAPVWIFLPLAFINIEQLHVCIKRARKANLTIERYNRITKLAKYIKSNNENVNEDTCVICLNQFEADEYTRRLPCGHVYHKGCIDDYFSRQINSSFENVTQSLENEKNPICAVCRQDIFCGDSAAP